MTICYMINSLKIIISVWAVPEKKCKGSQAESLFKFGGKRFQHNSIWEGILTYFNLWGRRLVEIFCLGEGQMDLN